VLSGYIDSGFAPGQPESNDLRLFLSELQYAQAQDQIQTREWGAQHREQTLDVHILFDTGRSLNIP
jgi:hypothetical protein